MSTIKRLFMKKFIMLLLAISLYGGQAMIFGLPVYAQEGDSSTAIQAPEEAPPTGINLTLSPVFLNLTADPGDEVTSQFRVTNNNNFAEFLELEIKKFESSETGPVIQDVQESDEFTRWVEFSETQFRLDANQTKTVRFTISPPEEASLGYYYAFVVNRMKPASGRSGAAIAGSPALPVLLSVKSPNAKREVQVVDFKTDQLVYEYLPANFLITVKNTGNVHVAPAGDIFIDSMFSNEVGIIAANKGRGNVLPDASRIFTTSWNDGFITRGPKMENEKEVKDDKGNTVYGTNYDFEKANKFRIGKYTANLVLVYDNGERDVPIEAQVSFWVIPWKIILGVLIVVVLALFGLRNVVLSGISGAKKLRGK